MTFVEYARARRIGIAMKQMRMGEAVMNTQIDMGYESSSGLQDAVSEIMGGPPTKFNRHLNILKATWLAISDKKLLYLLEFVDRRGLERELERLRIKIESAIIPGSTEPI
nr:hypothetical protein [Rickettsia endosymbiont of Proechinophthirus fluctus]